MTKRVLITGKNSYIGTSFIKYCNDNNYDLFIDEVDTRNEKWKEADFSQYDVVFHVAGIAHANAKKSQSDLYYKVNTDLTIKIAKHAKKHGVKQFIFMSSIIVYSSSKLENGKITDDTMPYSTDPYGDSKIKAENGILPLSDDNFKVVILRPPMIYGPNSKGNFPKLVKFTKYIKIFPKIKNKRSVLFIDNLSELVMILVKKDFGGTFYPQNKEIVSTTQIVKEISSVFYSQILFTTVFNPIIYSLKEKIKILNKVFGDLYYDKDINCVYFDYQIVDFKKSISKLKYNID